MPMTAILLVNFCIAGAIPLRPRTANVILASEDAPGTTQHDRSIARFGTVDGGFDSKPVNVGTLATAAMMIATMALIVGRCSRSDVATIGRVRSIVRPNVAVIR
jgi:hypothetical protein